MMRLLIIQFFISIVFTAPLAAQSNGIATDGKFGTRLTISDLNGRAFENRYDDVTGSPYFNAAYKFARLQLGDGQKFENIKIKLDLVSQETYFIAANNEQAFAGRGIIKEITYADTTSSGIKQYKFQTGFPAVDNQTANNFYQVLAEGRCIFLKSITKRVAEKKSELSGEISKDIETTENYYLFQNNEMKRLKKDKDALLAEFSDKKTEINQYMQSNKINYKNTDDIIKLINFYNSL